MFTQEQFIRNFSVMANGEVDFFLGACASIASGIPTGGDLIWEFKRTLRYFARTPSIYLQGGGRGAGTGSAK